MSDSDPKAWLSRVNLLLGLFFVLFALDFHLVNSLLKHLLELSLSGKLLIVVHTACLEGFTLPVEGQL
jgi:hypothetical protein